MSFLIFSLIVLIHQTVAYGFLYGCYPSLVADTFGIRGLSQNWGSMTLSAIIFGNIFNLAYGKFFFILFFVSPLLIDQGESTTRMSPSCLTAGRTVQKDASVTAKLTGSLLHPASWA